MQNAAGDSTSPSPTRKSELRLRADRGRMAGTIAALAEQDIIKYNTATLQDGAFCASLPAWSHQVARSTTRGHCSRRQPNPNQTHQQVRGAHRSR